MDFQTPGASRIVYPAKLHVAAPCFLAVDLLGLRDAAARRLEDPYNAGESAHNCSSTRATERYTDNSGGVPAGTHLGLAMFFLIDFLLGSSNQIIGVSTSVTSTSVK